LLVGMTGLWVLLAVLVLATAFGLWRRATDGRVRDVASAGVARPQPVPDGAPPVAVETPDAAHHGGEVLTGADLGQPLGERATLVQFSSAFCQPCRATRRVLDEVTGMVDGVAHVEVDAENRLDLVRRLDIMRTPTVLVLDATGAVRKRASGQPRTADVVAAIGEVA
jgi:thiol-disulfide isomerase/thioredoxin